MVTLNLNSSIVLSIFFTNLSTSVLKSLIVFKLVFSSFLFLIVIFSFLNIKFLLNIQTNTPDTKHIKQILVILTRSQ